MQKHTKVTRAQRATDTALARLLVVLIAFLLMNGSWLVVSGVLKLIALNQTATAVEQIGGDK